MDMSTKAKPKALYGTGSLFNVGGGIKSVKPGLLTAFTNSRLKEK